MIGGLSANSVKMKAVENGTFWAGAQEPCGTKMTQLSLQDRTGLDWTAH